MASISWCEHTLNHPHVINHGYNDFRVNGTIEPIGYIFYSNTVYFIDLRKYIRTCAHCGAIFNVYLYGELPKVLASFDGKTNLPIIATFRDVGRILKPRLYEEPRFGTFLHGRDYVNHNHDYDLSSGEYIIYCATETLKRRSISTILYTTNDKLALCCTSENNQIMLIDSDGKIINAIVVCSKAESNNRFEIGGGYLEYQLTEDKILVWSYISAAALKTKPATSVAE